MLDVADRETSVFNWWVAFNSEFDHVAWFRWRQSRKRTRIGMQFKIVQFSLLTPLQFAKGPVIRLPISQQRRGFSNAKLPTSNSFNCQLDPRWNSSNPSKDPSHKTRHQLEIASPE